GVHRSCARAFVEHLQRRFLPFFNRAARLENQAVIPREVRFSERATVTVQSLVRGRGCGRSREKGNAPMSQLQQMARGGVTCRKIVRLHVGELAAEWRA